MNRYRVVRSRTRAYGYAIQAPLGDTWAKGPGGTFGWYRRKRDAQARALVLEAGQEGGAQ